MRISIVTGTFHPEAGGPPRYLYRLATGLVDRGHKVRVATYGEPTPNDRYPFPVIRVSRQQPIPVRLARLSMLALHDGYSADLIFANDYGLPPTLANLIARKPLVMKIVSDFAWEYGIRHGLIPSDTTLSDFQRLRIPRRLGVVRRLQALYARLADAVVVPSAYLRGIVLGWGVDAERLHVVHNAVDSPRYPSPGESRLTLGLPTDANLIVTVARLVPWKGVDDVIQAAAKLRSSGRKVHLAVVGDGERRPELEALARGLGGAVTFAGEVSHDMVGAYLRSADVFTLASTYEGFSHVLLEALAAERPVVATAVGGNAELLVDGENGLTVAPRNHERLASALARVLDDAALRERLVAGAAGTVRRFSWDTLLQRTEALFEDVVVRHRFGKAG